MPNSPITPPWTRITVGIETELVRLLDDHVRQAGITKRRFYENAIRKELGLPPTRHDETATRQGILPLTERAS